MILAGRRGHPLFFLVALVLGWAGMRVVTWEQPLELDGAGRKQAAASPRRLAHTGTDFGADPGPRRIPNLQALQSPSPDDLARSELAWPVVPRALPGLVPGPLVRANSSARSVPPAPPLRATGTPPGGQQVAPTGLAVGHALLTAMGLSQMELPPELAALVRFGRRAGQAVAELAGSSPARPVAPQPIAPQPVAQPPVSAPSARRWGADTWLLLRDGKSAAPTAAPQPSYGRSQAGAVLRYRLAPGSAQAPQAYLRASTALRSPTEPELAAGLSARPIGRLPIRLAAEVRVIDAQAGTAVRPAAYAVTEFPPLALPLGLRGEVYAQAGYVGGKFATPFVDGQARVTRDVARLGSTQLSAGAGVWGGAQKDASRLDVGPSVALSLGVGQVFTRLSLDYRLRIAGDAEPRSGPALTLSTGF